MSSHIHLFLFLCLYRVINALLIQTQFDPDEYWQTLEPAYCIVFSNKANDDIHNCAYTWEWTRRYNPSIDTNLGSSSYPSQIWNQMLWGPVRSHIALLPTILFYFFARYFHIDTPFTISKGPILINALFIAAPTDLATYIIAKQMFPTNNIKLFEQNKQKYKCFDAAWWALISSLFSWFHGYALIRTYSNSMECMILTIGIAILAKDLFPSSFPQDSQKQQQAQNVDNNTRNLTQIIQNIKPSFVFFLGGISISIRFSSVAAWVPVGLLFCWRQKLKASSWKHFTWHLFVTCAFSGICGIFLSSLVDWYFYGFWTVPFIGCFHFNVVLGLGSIYGIHPWHWYLTCGLPAISGSLFPCFLYCIYIICRSRTTASTKDNQQKENIANLILIIIIYVGIHSISLHKEFRFILPILPLICVLSGHVIHNQIAQTNDLSNKKKQIISSDSNSKSKYKKIIWIYIFSFLLNTPHLLYLSLVHQAAPISVNKSIVRTIIGTEEKLLEESFKSESYTNVKEIYEPDHNYTVHYLMGCHSAPVFSHLHIPSIAIDVWTLDCSPQCRAEKNLTCESDLFHNDPLSFVNQLYIDELKHERNHDCGHNEDIQTQTCSELNNNFELKQVPDFIAIFESDAVDVAMMLEKLQFIEVSKFPHSVNGIRLKNDPFFIEFSFDYIVLYSKKVMSKINQSIL